MPTIQVRVFGGENVADEPTVLLLRSHQMAGGDWQQTAPMECQRLRNMDFRPQGLLKRLGSTLLSTITFSASDTAVIGGIEFVTNAGTRTHIVVTDTAIYYSTDGASSWARLTASGGGAYTHNATVSKCSFAVGDGRVFIGLDGNNNIQVYRTGTALDPAMANGNTYTEIYSGTNSITGTWGTGYYIVLWFQSRLLMSTGNSVMEYTPANRPWDRANGGFDQARAAIVAAKSFIRLYGNEKHEVLYYSTIKGGQFKTGFDLSDVPYNVNGTHPAFNHRCIVSSNSWLIYPTIHQTIEGISDAGVIDLGRRLKANDGTTGLLDTINLSNTQTKGFGFWNEKKKQAQFYVVDSTYSNVSSAAVLDFQLGEPVAGEGKEAFEQRVRCMPWSIKDPGSNAWFVDMYQARGAVIGLMASGAVYTVDSGLDDLGTLPVQDQMKTGDFQPVVGRNCNWRALQPRFTESGNWNVMARFYVNQAQTPQSTTKDFLQVNSGTTLWGGSTWGGGTWSGGNVVRPLHEVDEDGESLAIEFYNQQATQDWQINSFAQEYQVEAGNI